MMTKLIRDMIPEIVLAKGEAPLRTHIAKDVEYLKALLEKLQEETGELFAAPNDIGEYADVLEVLYALGAQHGMSPADIEAARIEKRTKRGGFEKKIIWENK